MLHHYDPKENNGKGMKVDKHETVELVQEDEDGWTKVKRDTNKKVGIVPTSFVNFEYENQKDGKFIINHQ